MTWVVGGAGVWSPFIVGDTRLTWANGDVEDCLQKVYQIAPNILAGFAGSVAIGLELLSDLKQKVTGAHSLHEMAYHSLPPLMRQHFRNARAVERVHESQFLLVGYEPGQEHASHRPVAHVFRFCSPHFSPETADRDHCIEIGSGHSDEECRLAMKAAYRQYSRETINIGRPYILPFTMAFRLHEILERDPEQGVSKWFVYGTATPQGSPVWPLSFYAVDGQSDELVSAPPLLIRSLKEFETLADERSISAEGAVA